MMILYVLPLPPPTPPPLFSPSLISFMVSVDVKHHVYLLTYFMSTETVCLLGTGAQDGHLDFHTAPEL